MAMADASSFQVAPLLDIRPKSILTCNDISATSLLGPQNLPCRSNLREPKFYPRQQPQTPSTRSSTLHMIDSLPSLTKTPV